MPLLSFWSECLNTLRVPVHTLSHHRSHFLFHICSCRSWKHQFIITRQTLLEPVRLCLAVEQDFPARKAGMDKYRVAQCILERMSCQWFPTHCVSRSPLSSLKGISSRAGEAGMTALPSGKTAAERKSCATKSVTMKPGSWSNLPISPRRLKAASPNWSFLVLQNLGDYKTIYTTGNLQDNIVPPA